MIKLSTEEWVFEKDRLLKGERSKRRGFTEELNLLVSLHGIEFSGATEGYFQVANNIYFSNLLYLLYVKRVMAGHDFERAKEKAKQVLVSQLERRKYEIISRPSIQDDEILGNVDTGRKLTLLNRAISVLEAEKSDSIYCNYDVPEDP
ncbi:MAG: hypothetical protein QXU18_05900 [Thermoplasmatales archaeon]